MAYIFMDESGDLGFDSNKKSSMFFVITFLFVDNKRSVEKIVGKVFSSFTKKQIRSRGGVLHCFKEDPVTRKKVLKLLAQKDISILTIYLNKKKVHTHLQDEKHVLYNYVTNILLDRLYTKKLVPTSSLIHVVASRRETNKFLNDNFKDYIQRQVQGRHKIKIEVSIESPSAQKCLQIVDFASWAIFRNREYQDKTYYAMIQSKIVEENPLFP